MEDRGLARPRMLGETLSRRVGAWLPHVCGLSSIVQRHRHSVVGPAALRAVDVKSRRRLQYILSASCFLN